jgi:hypothetical protein
MGVKINKKGQLTIFIILGIVLFIGIIAVILFYGKVGVEPKSDIGPKAIDKCIKNAIQPSTEKVMANGGRISPDLFIKYRNETYNYLCYQSNYYLSCINHYPQLKEIVEQEIKKDSDGRVKKCFSDWKTDLENKGYTVSEGSLNWDVTLLPKRVVIKVDKRFDVSRGESSQSFTEFNQNIPSPFNELVAVAREIVNQESQYCNFEYNGFMLLYPEFDIKRIDYQDSKVYRITDRLSGKIFKFAVRSCTFPPGL